MWEVVTAIGNDVRSERQEVVGGWIVRKFKTDEYGRKVEQAFVSDPSHKWKVYLKESFKPKTERVYVMGDKGGKKDKEKGQKQKTEKQQQKSKDKFDKQPKRNP
jgi:hypothetical protein